MAYRGREFRIVFWMVRRVHWIEWCDQPLNHSWRPQRLKSISKEPPNEAEQLSNGFPLRVSLQRGIVG